MFVYTVRIELPSEERFEALMRWLDHDHLGDVVRAGALDAEAVVLEEEDGRVVECRYRFASRAAFEAYERGPAEALRAEGRALFGAPTGVRMSRSTGQVRLQRSAE